MGLKFQNFLKIFYQGLIFVFSCICDPTWDSSRSKKVPLVGGEKNGEKRTLKGTEMEKNQNFREFYDPYWDFFARNLGCPWS